eukprot:13696072-Alexandrium_andersonii.AAC.1
MGRRLASTRAGQMAPGGLGSCPLRGPWAQAQGSRSTLAGCLAWSARFACSARSGSPGAWAQWCSERRSHA